MVSQWIVGRVGTIAACDGGAVMFGVCFVAGVQLYMAHVLALAAGFGGAALVTLVWLMVGR